MSYRSPDERKPHIPLPPGDERRKHHPALPPGTGVTDKLAGRSFCSLTLDVEGPGWGCRLFMIIGEW